MTKIRLKRQGSKFNVHYKIVVSDSKAPRDGRFIEVVGFYNPHSKELKVEKELIIKWLNDGAVPTITVKSLFKKYKINEEFILQKNSIKKSTTKKSVNKKNTSKKVSTNTKVKKTKKIDNKK
ncbi:MAG: 30S ribosomal protein S16 [Mycoplasma sp.]|nr:30S ribosomal protein S16 [Mycoplasma sp.]